MTNKKFTDEEIIKGLKELVQYTGLQVKYIQKLDAAFDLIIYQKIEIEKMNKKVEELSEVLSDTIRIRYAEAKSEAIKEFAEKLKEKISDCHIVNDGEYCGFDCGDVHECINNILKEMVSEEK